MLFTPSPYDPGLSYKMKESVHFYDTRCGDEAARAVIKLAQTILF